MRSTYDDAGVGDVALAFTPDGTLLVVYSVFREVRAVTMTANSELSEPVTVGPALERTRPAGRDRAERAGGGRVDDDRRR